MWAYIYYSIYLETIDTSEHSAIESFIYTLLREGHLEFFPLLVSLALEKEEATTAKQLEELKCMMQQLRARFEEEHEKARMRQTSPDSRCPSGFPPEASLDSHPSLEIPPSFDTTTFHP